MKARKLLSLLLTLCMVFSLFAGVSVTASAEENVTEIATAAELKSAVEGGATNILVAENITLGTDTAFTVAADRTVTISCKSGKRITLGENMEGNTGKPNITVAGKLIFKDVSCLLTSDYGQVAVNGTVDLINFKAEVPSSQLAKLFSIGKSATAEINIYSASIERVKGAELRANWLTLGVGSTVNVNFLPTGNIEIDANTQIPKNRSGYTVPTINAVIEQQEGHAIESAYLFDSKDAVTLTDGKYEKATKNETSKAVIYENPIKITVEGREEPEPEEPEDKTYNVKVTSVTEGQEIQVVTALVNTVADNNLKNNNEADLKSSDFVKLTLQPQNKTTHFVSEVAVTTASGKPVEITAITRLKNRRLEVSFTVPDEAVTVACTVAELPTVTVTYGSVSAPTGGYAAVPVTISGIGSLKVNKLEISYTMSGWTREKSVLNPELEKAGVTITWTGTTSATITAKAGEFLPDGLLMTHVVVGGKTDSKISTPTFNSLTLYDASGSPIPYTIPRTEWPLTVDANHAYTITVAESEHGTVTAEPAAAAKGATVTFTAEAEEGYALAGLSYTCDWNETSTKINGKTLTMPGDNITVTPVFSQSHTVTVDGSKNDNGTLSCSETSYVAGAYVRLTTEPNEGYDYGTLHYSYIDPETKELTEKTTNGTTFVMPDADVTVWIEWVLKYSITVIEPTEGGTLTCDTKSSKAGAEIRPKVTPAEGYDTVSVQYSADGGESWTDVEVTYSGGMKPIPTYKFTMPEADVLIRATFLPYSTVSAETPQNGTLVLSSTDKVRAGTAVQAYVFPAEGYHLSKLYYTVNDGEEVPFAGEFAAPETGAVKVYAEFSDDETTGAVSIRNAEDLLAYATTANADPLTTIGAVVKLAANIDLSSVEWPGIENFYGVFDGDGNTVTLGGSKGLFGTVKHAVVRNVALKGSISAETGSLAPLALVAWNTAVADCINETDVTAPYAAGLIDQLCYGSKLSGSINYGTISGVEAAEKGGAAGLVREVLDTVACELPDMTITNCGNYGELHAVNGNAGGIVCTLSVGKLTISGCRNSGMISTEVNENTKQSSNPGYAGTMAAGIIAYVDTNIYKHDEYRAEVTVTNCYNTGAVTAGSRGEKTDTDPSVAGIVAITGENDAGLLLRSKITVSNCYNTGILTKTGGDDLHRSHNTGYGEIATDYVWLGYAHVGYTGTSTEDSSLSGLLTKTNCFTSTDTFTASSLSDAYKEDENGVNKGKTPLLLWENGEVDDTPRTVKFEVVGPTTYELTVSANPNLSDPMTAEADGTYSAVPGTYYYRVAAEGYVIYKGSFSVVRSAPTVRVEMQKGIEVRFALTPANASITLSDSKGEVEIFEVSAGVYRATLLEGALYSYSVTADGYNSTQREFTAKAGTVNISLTQSSRPSVKPVYIYGDGNVGEEHTVTEGGSYYIGDGATGVLTIRTTEAVTLIGGGTADSSAFDDLYINCAVSGADLTLEDVFLRNSRGNGDPKMTNMINFRGTGNKLSFSGVSVLDQNTGATGYAMVHVPDGAELTVSGGTAYFYKREQGAGIGGNGGAKNGEGQDAETNGTIIIRDAELFFKNTKQGACIGAGAEAGTQAPGDIRIENSKLNLIANSRAAGIGGAAGSKASAGTNVYIDAASTLSINVDFSGAAIGGGGFDAGNDADGGTLYYAGGSIRAYIDTNAANNIDWGVEGPGVHGNKAVTAKVVNAEGEQLYLLVLSTSGVGGSEFTVKEGSTVIYSGTTHQWRYVNELLDKKEQIDIKYTIDNWVELDDPNLYLYMTGEDHTLDVNGTEFAAKWDEESKSFTVTNLSSGETVTPGKTETELPFTDVDGHWALDAIRYAYENKLFNGVSDTEFAPNTAMTRGMLVTVLYRLEGEPTVTANAKFSDVAEDQWYAKAVAWAAENEIVKGYGSTFGPNDLVTREQMATILLRYAVWKQYDTTAGGMALREYADYAEISGWATAALEWANAEGLILGRTETTIVPQGDATRAEVATILMRFIEKFAK